MKKQLVQVYAYVHTFVKNVMNSTLENFNKAYGFDFHIYERGLL